MTCTRKRRTALCVITCALLLAACSSGRQTAESQHDRTADSAAGNSQTSVTAHGKAEADKNSAGAAIKAIPSVSIKPASPGVHTGTSVVRNLHGKTSAIRTQAYRGPTQTGPVKPENYGELDGNPVQRVAQQPVSTFSIDVDTGSYTRVRAMLNAGHLPPDDAVRTEEFINYFDYSYPVPENPERPFSVTTTLAPTPWNADTHLLRIGIQGWLPPGELPPANLVFLIDVSGSMRPANKLPLLKSGLKLLARQLDAEDRISIVAYAGNSRLVLKPTQGDKTARILRAINDLQAGGSTNGSAGIRTAYNLAHQATIEGGINRVILATDGDFNVGTVNFEALVDRVAHQRESGIALTALGFGTGNYNAHLIEQLADRGNGNYAYIDSLSEAERVLVSNRAATLRTIAKDVKIQIEFNPAVVAEYRLIGYENRMLDREDFNNDNVDAGEIGAGHDVTALYEIALVGSRGTRMNPLRYQTPDAKTANTDELAFLRLRYKLPDEDNSRLIGQPIATASIIDDLAATGDDMRFAAAVAAFGQLLRGGTYTNDFDYQDVLALAREARGEDADARRGEFLQLVQLAAALSAPK